jgi:membrane protease YdiL (CAAX protease family)
VNPGAAERPRPVELLLVVLTGAGHVSIELWNDGLRGAADSLNRPQHVYNLAAVAAWGAYLVWRAIRIPGTSRDWGFRRDGFRGAMRIGIPVTAVATVPLLLFGWWQGRLPLPIGFWLVAALYPLWGIAQQFALQALITRNLRGFVPRPGVRALAAAGIFSASHFPTAWLMALTLIAGVGFTLLYERHRNLWAVGLLHGILGALAYYCVLGQDPGAELTHLICR